MAIAIVAGALANKPESGGEAWVRLSWALGLRRLGWEVHLVERLEQPGPAAQQYFGEVTAAFGLDGSASLLDAHGEALHGHDEKHLLEVAAEADLLFNISGHLGPGPLRSAPRRRVYVDLDPGFTQAWHADPGLEFTVAGHDAYVTVGQNIGRAGCPVPTAGIEWVPTLPPVLLDEWPAAPPPAQPLTFTTVATWRSPYGSLVIDGREMSLKHHQFRRFVTLPERVDGVELELALDIHPGDAADLELLQEHGWRLADPREVAATPAAFRDYVRRSGAEFSVAQGVYVEAKTGWFSDRTAAYLASGRPAVVQDTGCSAPIVFEDVDSAAAGVEAARGSYEARAAEARRFAEQHLDSDRVLSRLLEISLALVALVFLLPLVTLGSARAAAPSPQVQVVGEPQVVFDWSEEACVPQGYPDLPARAFRDELGRAQLLISHSDNFRLIGPELGRLHPDCDAVMASSEDSRPSAFADREWIASIFTRDGHNVWALVHDEYQGDRHPGRCPSGSYYRCWYNAITLARSTDGGRTFRPSRPPPRHLVAAPSFRYRPGIGPRGVFGPSNIVTGPDAAQYALIRIRDLDGQRGVCVIRSRRISLPGSWRGWDGSGFRGRFRNPYRAQPQRRAPCRPVDPGRIAEMTESLTFNSVLDRYLLVGLAPPGPLSVGAKVRGIYYATSTDLVHWSPRTLVAAAVTKQSYRCGGRAPIAYPSVIDPHSGSRSFATSGARPYLYFTRFNYRGCRQTPDRDLVRVRLAVAP
ncbi:MAG: hypothetical protein ACJ76B_02570 [Solirubrobacterales bacterium]